MNTKTKMRFIHLSLTIIFAAFLGALTAATANPRRALVRSVYNGSTSVQNRSFSQLPPKQNKCTPLKAQTVAPKKKPYAPTAADWKRMQQTLDSINHKASENNREQGTWGLIATIQLGCIAFACSSRR